METETHANKMNRSNARNTGLPKREYNSTPTAFTFNITPRLVCTHVLGDDCLSFACNISPISSAMLFFLEATCIIDYKLISNESNKAVCNPHFVGKSFQSINHFLGHMNN